MVFYDGDLVEVQNVPLKYQEPIDDNSQSSRVSLDLLLTAATAQQKVVERQILSQALQQNNWNRERTAKVLGIDRKTFYRKLREHQIE